jgi:hypothetical protein
VAGEEWEEGTVSVLRRLLAGFMFFGAAIDASGYWLDRPDKQGRHIAAGLFGACAGLCVLEEDYPKFRLRPKWRVK